MSSTRPKTLLVLSDPGFAASIANYIGSRGFDPVLVKGGAAAVETLSETHPSLVVASQLLSGMDGATLCQKLKLIDPILPVVIISAVVSSAGLADVKRISGADVVLPSTFQPEALIAAMRKLTTTAVPRDTAPSKGFSVVSPPTPSPAPSPAPAPAAMNATRVVTQRSDIGHSAAMQEVSEQMRAAKTPDGPPQKVDPLPLDVAVANTPVGPIDPSWLISRALVDNVTGALRFVNRGVERIVYFAQGRPIVVTSNVAEERIGQILIRKGKMAARELDQALSIAQKKGKKLGDVIVEMGVMTMREHDEELASQYTERLLALFGWQEASIEFRPYPAPDELVQIRLAPERVVVEGLRRHYDMTRLEIALRDPNRILFPAPNAAERVPFLNLTQIEAAALVLIDGRRSIAEACTLAPGRLEALRALYACIGLNLLV